MQTKKMFDNHKLFQILWPLLVEQLLTVLVGMVDVLMVAVLGEAAVSGVSLVDSVNNLIIQVLFAMCAAGTVAAAFYYGAGKKEGVGKTLGQLLLLTVTGSLIIMLIMVFGRKLVMGLLFGAIEADVMNNALTYLLITSLSLPFLAIYNSGSAAFRAVGNTRLSMIVSMGMNLFNIAGNAVCIFGLHMGVEGVAIPTLIARILGATVIIMIYQKSAGEGRIRGIESFRPDGVILRKIVSIGIPNSIESGVFQFGKLMLQSLVATLGTASIAGFAVASNLVTYLYLPGNALGAAMITVVGQCIGAGYRDQAKDYAKKLTIINYAILAGICTVLIVGRHFFVGCYNLSGESAFYAQGLIFAHSIAMIIWPIGFLLPYYFRALGKATFTMIVAISTMWIFRIGFAYLFILVLHMNVLGVWYAMFVDWIVRAIVYIIAFRREKVE